MPNPFNQKIIPRLPERRDNAENFLTYLILATCNCRPVIQWQNHAELKRNFELYQECSPRLAQLCSQPNQAQNIAEFWREIAINSSLSVQDWEPKNRKTLALQHLASYFEKDCYYAAIEVGSKSSDCFWEEYLYCARVFIWSYENFIRPLAKKIYVIIRSFKFSPLELTHNCKLLTTNYNADHNGDGDSDNDSTIF